MKLSTDIKQSDHEHLRVKLLTPHDSEQSHEFINPNITFSNKDALGNLVRRMGDFESTIDNNPVKDSFSFHAQKYSFCQHIHPDKEQIEHSNQRVDDGDDSAGGVVQKNLVSQFLIDTIKEHAINESFKTSENIFMCSQETDCNHDEEYFQVPIINQQSIDLYNANNHSQAHISVSEESNKFFKKHLTPSIKKINNLQIHANTKNLNQLKKYKKKMLQINWQSKNTNSDPNFICFNTKSKKILQSPDSKTQTNQLRSKIKPMIQLKNNKNEKSKSLKYNLKKRHQNFREYSKNSSNQDNSLSMF